MLAPRAVHAGCLRPGTRVDVRPKGDARRPYPALCGRSRTADGGALNGIGLSGSIASSSAWCASRTPTERVAHAGTARFGQARMRVDGRRTGAVTERQSDSGGSLELSANCQRSPYSEPPGSPNLSQAGSPMLSHPGAGIVSHPAGRDQIAFAYPQPPCVAVANKFVAGGDAHGWTEESGDRHPRAASPFAVGRA